MLTMSLYDVLAESAPTDAPLVGETTSTKTKETVDHDVEAFDPMESDVVGTRD